MSRKQWILLRTDGETSAAMARMRAFESVSNSMKLARNGQAEMSMSKPMSILGTMRRRVLNRTARRSGLERLSYEHEQSANNGCGFRTAGGELCSFGVREPRAGHGCSVIGLGEKPLPVLHPRQITLVADLLVRFRGSLSSVRRTKSAIRSEMVLKVKNIPLFSVQVQRIASILIWPISPTTMAAPC